MPGPLGYRDPSASVRERHQFRLGSSRWLRLGGGLRAAGDCAAARQMLIEMSKGMGSILLPAPDPDSAHLPRRLAITAWRSELTGLCRRYHFHPSTTRGAAAFEAHSHLTLGMVRTDLCSCSTAETGLIATPP